MLLVSLCLPFRYVLLYASYEDHYPFTSIHPFFCVLPKVVLAPIAIGMTTNKFFPGFVKKILPFAPVVGVVSTCLLVASAVAQVAEPIISAGLKLQVCL